MPAHSSASQASASPLLPPGPDSQWLTDPAKGAPGKPLEFLQNLTRDFGDVVHYSTPYGPVYFFNHPDGVRQVLHSTNIVRTPLATLILGQGLASSDGDYWRKQKRIMQPDFREGCVMGFGPLITNGIERTLQRWQRFSQEKQPLDMAHEMRLLTLDIAGHALFSADLNDEAESICEVIGIMIEEVDFMSSALFNSAISISPTRNARFQEARASVERVVYDLIEKRRQLKVKPRDLLTTLVTARDAETGEPLSDLQLRDEIVTILFAGQETTALAFTWAWHLLAENPDVLHRLQREADEVLGGRLPTIADLPRLRYSEMVLNEAMRVRPPVWNMTRTATNDEVIGGYRIPAKAFVVVSPYTTHRHPEFWSDSERFDPERFSPENSESRPLYAHFPFAGGRHLCVGLRFSMIEGQMILAALAQKFNFRSLPHPPVVPQFSLTLRLKFGVPMIAEARQ